MWFASGSTSGRPAATAWSPNQRCVDHCHGIPYICPMSLSVDIGSVHDPRQYFGEPMAFTTATTPPALPMVPRLPIQASPDHLRECLCIGH